MRDIDSAKAYASIEFSARGIDMRKLKLQQLLVYVFSLRAT